MKKNKNLLGIFSLAFILNLIENIILLVIFGVKIEMNTIIGAVIFSIVLTFMLKSFNLTK
jgi:hypothetical protein